MKAITVGAKKSGSARFEDVAEPDAPYGSVRVLACFVLVHKNISYLHIDAKCRQVAGVECRHEFLTPLIFLKNITCKLVGRNTRG